MNTQTLPVSPNQTSIIGIGVHRTSYEECTDIIIENAKRHQSCTVAATDVHSMMRGYLDPKGHGYRLNNFTLVTPDGQPVRWALNLFRKSGEKYMSDRVRGPELMLRVCKQAADEGVSIFLYGSTDVILEQLQVKLTQKFPNLKIAGAISPPFRPLTPEEDAEYVQTIRQSGAGIVFVGLGCPKQEDWAFSHRYCLDCPILCVGAAFDMHAGQVQEAPILMQQFGLEWLYRFIQEPVRLWKRYLLINPLYLVLVTLQLFKVLPSQKKPNRINYQASHIL